MDEDAQGLQEKVSCILRDLHNASREIENDPRIRKALSEAATGVAEILVLAFGRQHSDEILREGTEGFEMLAWRLGFIPETSAQRRRRELCELLIEIEKAVEGSRSEGRTRAAELLECHSSDSRFEALAELTERVTQGTLGWPEYQRAARQVIYQMRVTHLPELI